MWRGLADSNDFIYGMSGYGINDETLLPTENIVLSGNVTGFFYRTNFTNLKKLLDDARVVLDLSEVTRSTAMFNLSSVTEIPDIDLSKATGTNQMFSGATKLRKIWGITMPKAESCNVADMFANCSALEEITVNGTIVVNGLNFSACTKLSKASIESIMDALSTTVSGKSITLSLVAVDKAFETSEGANDGRYSDAWYELYYAHTDKWAVSLL